jgi:hypothetical protein
MADGVLAGGVAESLVTEVGTIVGETGAVLARAELQFDNDKHQRTTGDAFVIELDSGRDLTVEADANQVVVIPEHRRRDRWDSLGQDEIDAFIKPKPPSKRKFVDAALQLFADIPAPVGHKFVRLAGFALVPRQRIVVRGRMDPAGKLVASKISIVEHDDDAAAIAAMDPVVPKALKPKKSRLRIPLERTALASFFGGAAMVVAGVLTWPTLALHHQVPVALLVAGIYAMIAGLALTIARLPLDGFEVGAEYRKPDPPWQTGAPLIAVGASFVGAPALLAIAFPTGFGVSISASVCAALFGLVVAAWIVSRRGPLTRTARSLLGSTDALSGVVQGDQPAFTRCVSYSRRPGMHSVAVSNPSGGTTTETQMTHWVEGSVTASALSDVVVLTGDGRSVRITSVGAHWLARLDYEATRGFAKTIAKIDAGDHVLIAGKLRTTDDGALTMVATRPGSLVLFGAPRDPRSALRRILVGWYTLLFVEVGMCGACVWIAISVAS